jgi:hypothetical protein
MCLCYIFLTFIRLLYLNIIIDLSSSTYASISFRAILNQVVEKVRLNYYGGEPFFTRNWKYHATLTFYRPEEPEAPLFDVLQWCVWQSSEAEESALICALAYFDGVIGWTIGDIDCIPFLRARDGPGL